MSPVPPQEELDKAQALANERGESAWLSVGMPLTYVGPIKWRIVMQSQLSPIAAHCAHIEVKPAADVQHKEKGQK